MPRKKYQLLILLLIAVAIRIFALFPEAVEKYYTQGIYPYIALIQRTILGWIPFSIGDLLYGGAVLYLIIALVKFIRSLIQKKTNRTYWFRMASKTVFIVLWVYILFNLGWGLNYNRLGIAKQLNLHVARYSAEDLADIVELTIDKLKSIDTIALSRRDSFNKKSFLFKKAVESYEKAVAEFSFLEYERPSVKPSLYSYLGNYLGYSGYYNPFTGEAQVNTAAPMVLQPFVVSHEIGHQLGYAKENEANFAGYLAARSSPDPAVQYSVYFDLYIYAWRNLRTRDSLLAKALYLKLPEIAKNDLRELRKFYDQYENPFEPVVRALYGQYLKANEQPEGILSYDEVMAWIIAYYKKFRKI